jgi:two-component system, response regulator
MNSKKVDILFIEDNHYEAKLAIHNLKKHDLAANLLHLNDGELAVDYLFGTGAYAGRDISRKPKVILLDINLPKVNGMDILSMVKSDPRTSSIPVVILTASRESEDIKTGYALGANSYIVKPVDFESFSRTVSDLGIYWTTINQSTHYIQDTLWMSISDI